MGAYTRGWNFLSTPKLDALPGKLSKLSKTMNEADAQLLMEAAHCILALRAGLTTLESSLATRSRPSVNDVAAVLHALNHLEKSSQQVTVRKGYHTEMVTITPVDL